MASDTPLTGPDFADGLAAADVHEGQPLLGHLAGEPVVLVRANGQVHALGATCTHYGGPLADGIVADGTIRCPWHHACFDLATGRAHGPAIAPVACYDIALEGGTLRVGAKRSTVPAAIAAPEAVVIVGAGAAGVACVEALRANGHRGAITLISSEGSDPVDRPNLSKDYLAGNAPEEWVFLRTAQALRELDVALESERATAIDRDRRRVTLASGRTVGYDALVLATGAEPNRLAIPGADLPHVHVLRTLADSRAIAEAAASGPVVVIGSSFIGLEVAAALRVRGASVTVVGPEQVPLARVLGDEVGAFVRRVHEGKGVVFELGRKPTKITAREVVLDDGRTLPATAVVLGIGVHPRLELAQAAGLTIDRGVVVGDRFEAAPGIWAIGDIARFPFDGEHIRVEHWQVAVRHGQAAARAILGLPVRRDVPFFWSQHHDVTLGYVGHAEHFDRAELHGSLEAGDAHVVYRTGTTIKAVVTLGRDKLALEAELAMEHRDAAALERVVAGSI
ncbi:MAG: FAD-dependent oxidoreductase [Kofleriaceae bacterium]